MHPVGFEPTHLTIPAPKAGALDHSAKGASVENKNRKFYAFALNAEELFILFCCVFICLMFLRVHSYGITRKKRILSHNDRHSSYGRDPALVPRGICLNNNNNNTSSTSVLLYSDCNSNPALCKYITTDGTSTPSTKSPFGGGGGWFYKVTDSTYTVHQYFSMNG